MPFWGTAFYRRPGGQASNTKDIFLKTSSEIFVCFWLFVRGAEDAAMKSSSSREPWSMSGETLVKSKVSNFEFITAVLTSVLHLKTFPPHGDVVSLLLLLLLFFPLIRSPFQRHSGGIFSGRQQRDVQHSSAADCSLMRQNIWSDFKLRPHLWFHHQHPQRPTAMHESSNKRAHN